MNPKDIHVAMITPWNRRGGIADYSKQLISNLADAGVEATPVPISHPRTPNPRRFNSIFDDLPPSADVVHVQFEAGLFGRLGTSGVCTPSFYNRLGELPMPSTTTLHEVHGSHTHRTWIGNRILEWRDFYYEGRIISSSDAVVVHTTAAEKVLRDRHGDGFDVVALRYPVEEETVSVSKDEARKRIGLEDVDQLILTFGWIEPRKRYESVVESLPDLPGVTYAIAGEPRDRQAERYLNRVLERAAELGVRDRVYAMGYIEDTDVKYLFNAVDAVILPYDRISMSSVLNLGLAYRCPTIAPSLPVFEEVRDEYNCVVTYGDGKSLSEVLERALTDQSLRKRLVRNAETYAESESWSSFAKRTTETYQDLVQR